MYLAVDVGGTKTLLASFEESTSKLVNKVRFPTAKKYDEFLADVAKHLPELGTKSFTAAGVGMPGRLDRASGVCLSYGNLGWVNTPVKTDLERLFGCPVSVENDAKVGGLSEANIIKDEYKTILYIPIGTGVGVALITNGIIDTTYGDRGGKAVTVTVDGHTVEWERIASGRAISHQFGKQASDITDEESWKIIARNLALGLAKLIEEKQPDAVVIGGGAGKPFNRYGDLLKAELSQLLPSVPAILPATHPEEAVLYGCIDLIKQQNG